MHPGAFSRLPAARPQVFRALPGFSAARSKGNLPAYSATDIGNLSPAAWFRFNVGVAVSQWTDQSGNNRHLLQATGGNQPTLPGDGSLLFNGTSQFMACTNFTLNQPASIYMLVQPVTWVNLAKFTDGGAGGASSFGIEQTSGTPLVRFRSGSALGNISVPLSSYSIITAIANGTSSLLQLGTGTPVTGNAGASNPGGFTLAALNGGASGWSNIQVKEVILFPVSHAPEVRSRIIGYMQTL